MNVLLEDKDFLSVVNDTLKIVLMSVLSEC